MQAKEYLGQVLILEKKIRKKINQIEHLRIMSSSISACVNSDGSSVQIKGTDKLGMIVARIVDMENELSVLVKDYLDKRKLIESQIDSLENEDFSLLLSSVYLLGKSLTNVATEMSLSYSHAKRCHAKAINSFSDKFM